MADAAAGAAPEGAAAGGGKKVGMIGALTFAGALLGGLGASLVVAPRLIPRPAPAAQTGDSAAAEGQAGGSEGEHGTSGGKGDEGERRFVELDNIVVNPAGSQGTRFVMASVAIAVENEQIQEKLHGREVELRDRVTGILESMTLAEVSAAGARDSLKSRIAVVAKEMLGTKAPVQVFLPQFVVQ